MPVRTVTRKEFIKNPDLAFNMAIAEGTIQLTDDDGMPRGTISVPRLGDPLCEECETRQMEIDALKIKVKALEVVLDDNVSNTYDNKFPLRAKLNVSFKNLPRDLTANEASRIAAFLQSLVMPDSEHTNEPS